MDFEFQVLDSLPLELGFRIPVDFTRISEKAQESGSHNSNFPDSKFQQPKISRIPDSGFQKQNFPDSRFHKQAFHGFPYIGQSMRLNRIEFSPINVITVTKKRLIILITLRMLNNFWIRFLWYPGIIKVEVSVISRAEGRDWYHFQRPWLFRISRKPNLSIVLLYIVLKKITSGTPSQGTWILILLIEIMHCARSLKISTD